MREGRVQPKITQLPRRCHLLLSLPRSRTRTTLTLRTLWITRILRKVPIYLIPPEMDSWTRPLMPLVMDILHHWSTPSPMTFKPIDLYISYVNLRVPCHQICHHSRLVVSSPLDKQAQLLDGSFPVTTMIAKILRSFTHLCLFLAHITALQFLLHSIRTDKHPLARVKPSIGRTTNWCLVLHTQVSQ